MHLLEGLPNFRTTERRPFLSEVQFSYTVGNIRYVGSGRARDFNGEFLSFETDQLIGENSEIELRLPCEFALQRVCSLELIVRGRVVRKESGVSVIRLGTCEFHTWGSASFNQTETRGTICNQVM
jgi:hypothetical protein